jgi:hypothetical protein
MDEHTTPPNPPDEAGTLGDTDDEMATLRALALALGLLLHRYRGPQQEDAQPELLVGRLPADLPFTLPLPEGSRLLATLVNEHPLVVLESELVPDAVADWYEERLLASGWRKLPEPVHPRVGFVSAEEAAPTQHVVMPRLPFAAFVLGEDGPGLGVEALAGPDGRTVAHLTVHRDAAAGFGRARILHHQSLDRWAAMPALVPPPDVQQWNDGASGSSERIHLNGRLRTDLDLATVMARYGEQLEQHGWQRQDGAWLGRSPGARGASRTATASRGAGCS